MVNNLQCTDTSGPPPIFTPCIILFPTVWLDQVMASDQQHKARMMGCHSWDSVIQKWWLPSCMPFHVLLLTYFEQGQLPCRELCSAEIHVIQHLRNVILTAATWVSLKTEAPLDKPSEGTTQSATILVSVLWETLDQRHSVKLCPNAWPPRQWDNTCFLF